MTETIKRLFAILNHGAAGGVTEVCVFQGGEVPTHAGYFDNHEAAAKTIRGLDGKGNLFVTVNPVKRDLLARGNNRLIEGSFKRKLKRTKDVETLCESWFFLDIDAERPSGISSTDAELYAAIEAGAAVRDWLIAAGVPASAILTAKSGNGAYVLVRLPNYDAAPARATIKAALLKHLASLFNTPSIKIDLSVKNDARLMCALGTMKVKGESIPERPHRRSSIETVGGEGFDPAKDQRCEPFDLYSLAEKILPKEEPAPKSIARSQAATFNGHAAFDIREYIDGLGEGKEARGFSYHTCPGCHGVEKLHVNQNTGAYGCFHIGAGTCSYEAIRTGLGRPKGAPNQAARQPAFVSQFRQAADEASEPNTARADSANADKSLQSVLFQGDRELTIEVRGGARGNQIVTARCGGIVGYQSEFRLMKPDSRSEFVAAIPDRDGDERRAIDAELLQMSDRFLAKENATQQAGDGAGVTIAARLVSLCERDAELFHDSARTAFVSLDVDGRRETYRLESREFKDWLARQFWLTAKSPVSGESLAEALGVLRGTACYDGKEIETHVRLAGYGEAIYLDLGDSTWRQVEITASGWQVIESAKSPVRFRRASGLLALPEPVRGGELRELRELLNLPSPDDSKESGTKESGTKESGTKKDDNWPLVLGWIVATFKPSNTAKFSYPLLAVHGEQGSAKSTTCRNLRRLIDPNKSDLRCAPKDERDLAIAAEHSRIIAYDNLTYLSESLSNALCRLSTGGGFATRELYSDEGEVIFDAQRPVILNGISEVVSKSDLLDRSILLYLPRIKKGRRKLERTLDREFKAAQPRILGALLDAVSVGLQQMAAGVELGDDLPRMADFYEWAIACEKGFGLEAGAFKSAYWGNIEKANGLAIDASPAAQAIVSMLTECIEYQGTVGALLKALNDRLVAAGDNPKGKQGWPRTARKLGALLKEFAPNLRRNGIGVTLGERTRAGFLVTLARFNESESPDESEKDVHNVRDVHATNEINDLEREHRREHPENDLSADVHAADEAGEREHWADERSGDVHANVHALNHSKQRAGELREHREHLPLPASPQPMRRRITI